MRSKTVKSDSLFSQFYNFDESTNRYMIEIALDEYTDIFNEWHPAPFKRRQIDPDLYVYLEGSCEEIPSNYPIELYFSIPKQIYNQHRETEVRSALKNCFTFKIYFLKRQIKKINIRMLRYAFIGLVLLWFGSIFPTQYSETILINLVTDGIVIGGWVFLWEAVSLFFFTNRELSHQYFIYRRLLNAPIIFAEIIEN